MGVNDESELLASGTELAFSDKILTDSTDSQAEHGLGRLQVTYPGVDRIVV